MSNTPSSISKKSSTPKFSAEQPQFPRSQSSRSIKLEEQQQHVATSPPAETPLHDNVRPATSLDVFSNATATSPPASVAGMTFTPVTQSSLSLEELRRRVEQAQLGKVKSAENTGAKDMASPQRGADNIAARRAATERTSSSRTTESQSSFVPSASTDSAKTVRGDITSPGQILTPSYPFPRIPLRLPRGLSQQSNLSHKPFTLLSPTNGPIERREDTTPASVDPAESEMSTPAQNPRFQPSRMPSTSSDPNFPTPNLYDVVLALSSEPGIDAWWSNVIQILQDTYAIERASLAIPGDFTDLENVPWGQKATFNVMGTQIGDSSAPESTSAEPYYQSKEPSSGTDLRRFGSSLSAVKEEPRLLSAPRPPLENRHSFAGHHAQERPKAPARASSNYANIDARSFNPIPSAREAVEGSPLNSQEQIMKEGNVVAVTDTMSQSPLAVVYRVPQPLEAEKDPLLLRTGVTNLFGRSRPVVLTREYTEESGETGQGNAQDKGREGSLAETQWHNKAHDESSNSGKRVIGSLNLDSLRRGPRHLTPSVDPRHSYEDYEQPEPSPWSQSPAPSPAARPDPITSPFFVTATSGTLDEDAFQRNPPTYDYSEAYPLEAIGADASKTLIHIPLVQHVPSRGKATSSLRFPMAILSILSPMTPYPVNLRRSLGHLLPHLASTYSLALQYSNLETRVSGMMGPHYFPGYGLGGTFSDESSELELVAELSGQIAQGAISAHSSLHSPSGSAASRESPASSAAGTPAFDHTMFGLSPGLAMTPSRLGSEMVDSYFTAKRNRASAAQSGRSKESSGNHRPSVDESPATKGKKGKVPATASRGPKSAVPRGLASSSEERTQESDERRSVSSVDMEQNRQMSSSSILTTRGTRDLASRPLPDLISQLMLNSVPLQLFLAKPKSGELVWTNARFQAFRSSNGAERVKDPWQNVHPEDQEALEQGWKKVLKSGAQFTMHIRVRRFNNDADYRWFIFRASTLLSHTSQILYFIGSFMDVHEQHLAELKAAEEKEMSARDAKYRALANSIPQILFEAVENQGIVSTNDQWHVYSGQSLEDALNLGFARHVHRDDLTKCGLFLPAIFFSDNGPQDFTFSLMDQHPQDTVTTFSESSNSSHQTVQAIRSGDVTPQRAIAPTLSALVEEGVISVQDDEGGRPAYSIELRLRSKSGEFRWFLVRLVKVNSPLLNEGRASWYGTCTDIHDRKNLERELNSAMSKLNQEMESKTRFFANMSHEIRTPLNGILGSIPWLLDSVLDIDQRRTLDTIQNSSNNLRELVDNILDVTKVEAGKMTLVHRWFHVRSLLEDTIETISSRAIDRGLELNYTVDLEVPHTVKGDAFRLRQVLINLIGNAVKFTEHGEIYAHCSIRKDKDIGPNKLMLAFDVMDTGKGFSEEDLQRLFKQFGQIEGSHSQHEAGTGLGLFLSKQLVEMHGGHMTASGQENQGATFSFWVLVGLPTPEDHPTSPSVPKVKRKVSGIPEALPPPSPGANLTTFATKDDAQSPLAGRNVGSPGLSSPGPLSTTSSVPSFRSIPYLTDRSTPSSLLPTPESVQSLNTSKLAAAMAPSERQKLAELAMASSTVIEGLPNASSVVTSSPHPTTYSIVVICPAKYARNAFKQHIEQVVPHEIAANVTTMADIDEWLLLYNTPTPPVFTHVVLDLPDANSINFFMQQISLMKTSLVPELVIITDHYQKRDIMDQQKTLQDSGGKVYLVTKPVKPSVFALIFDPAKLRNLSKDRGRDIAQAKTEDFKNVAEEVRETVGDRNFRILVVEDSDVNRMVILKYLRRVHLESETAINGLECTQMVLAKGLDYYSLIICDIQMPLKNGYDVCKELRQWERESNRPPMPIMALSANAMPEEKAVAAQAGFTDYLTKPVDFNTLGRMMITLLDSSIPHVFLRDRLDRLGG